MNKQEEQELICILENLGLKANQIDYVIYKIEDAIEYNERIKKQDSEDYE